MGAYSAEMDKTQPKTTVRMSQDAARWLKWFAERLTKETGKAHSLGDAFNTLRAAFTQSAGEYAEMRRRVAFAEQEHAKLCRDLTAALTLEAMVQMAFTDLMAQPEHDRELRDMVALWDAAAIEDRKHHLQLAYAKAIAASGDDDGLLASMTKAQADDFFTLAATKQGGESRNRDEADRRLKGALLSMGIAA